MEEENNPALAALRRQIREQEKENPHIAAQIASRILLDKLLALLKDDSGVHVESAFAMLGALAGYACQQSAVYALAHGDNSHTVMVVDGADGKQYLLAMPSTSRWQKRRSRSGHCLPDRRNTSATTNCPTLTPLLRTSLKASAHRRLANRACRRDTMKSALPRKKAWSCSGNPSSPASCKRWKYPQRTGRSPADWRYRS